MPVTSHSEDVRQKWLENARSRGLRVKKIAALPTLVNGKVRNVATQDAVYDINGRVTNIKFADDDWFSIGNRTLENIEAFVFICKQPSVFYSIPINEMKLLAAMTPPNSYDQRREFHIFPSSNKYPAHTYYSPGGTKSVLDYYQDWTLFTKLSLTEGFGYDKHMAPATALPTLPSTTEDLLKSIAADLSVSAETRRRAKVELDIAVRDRKFRLGIMAAYGHKCSICGRQLGMVQGAHILPVGKNGSDELTNGIALCNDHHPPYDKGIIFIDPDYYIRLNTKKVQELKSQSLGGGLDEFVLRARVGQQISLPTDRKYWPNKDYILERMKLEGLE